MMTNNRINDKYSSKYGQGATNMEKYLEFHHPLGNNGLWRDASALERSQFIVPTSGDVNKLGQRQINARMNLDKMLYNPSPNTSFINQMRQTLTKTQQQQQTKPNSGIGMNFPNIGAQKISPSMPKMNNYPPPNILFSIKDPLSTYSISMPKMPPPLPPPLPFWEKMYKY